MINVAGAVAVEAIDPDSRDAGVAAHYGDPMREQRLLATDVGLVDRSHRSVLAVPGVERASWLHSLTIQHLAGLRAGQGTELLVLSPHGHVEHHALVAEDGDTTWLDTEPGSGPDLLTFLSKMRFLTRVEPRDATAEWAVLSLVGPRALEALGLPLKDPEVRPVPGPKFAAGSIPSTSSSLYAVQALPSGGLARRGRLGVDLIVPRDAVTDQPPAAGTPVTTEDGRAVGFVGTAVRHFELGMVALAVVKRNVPDAAPLRAGESAAAIDLG